MSWTYSIKLGFIAFALHSFTRLICMKENIHTDFTVPLFLSLSFNLTTSSSERCLMAVKSCCEHSETNEEKNWLIPAYCVKNYFWMWILQLSESCKQNKLIFRHILSLSQRVNVSFKHSTAESYRFAVFWITVHLFHTTSHCLITLFHWYTVLFFKFNSGSHCRNIFCCTFFHHNLL